MESESLSGRPGAAQALEVLDRVLLPHVPRESISAAYLKAPGNEILSGKFSSPESSSALVANSFGIFLAAPGDLPPLPRLESVTWPATDVKLEACVRFPWAGGRHPYLDVLVRTPDVLIGIESKRFEPFRAKSPKEESGAYRRDVWGERMSGYRQVWDKVTRRDEDFEYLDARQLIKHAFAIRTQVHRANESVRQGVLYYLYAEPACWPDGRVLDRSDLKSHRREIGQFSDAVAGDEVTFVTCSYDELFSSWLSMKCENLAAHATAVRHWAKFSVS